jgi:hypothetical protein
LNIVSEMPAGESSGVSGVVLVLATEKATASWATKMSESAATTEETMATFATAMLESAGAEKEAATGATATTESAAGETEEAMATCATAMLESAEAKKEAATGTTAMTESAAEEAMATCATVTSESARATETTTKTSGKLHASGTTSLSAGNHVVSEVPAGESSGVLGAVRVFKGAAATCATATSVSALAGATARGGMPDEDSGSSGERGVT